jgi:hypothetical protein
LKGELPFPPSGFLGSMQLNIAKKLNRALLIKMYYFVIEQDQVSTNARIKDKHITLNFHFSKTLKLYLYFIDARWFLKLTRQ